MRRYLSILAGALVLPKLAFAAEPPPCPAEEGRATRVLTGEIAGAHEYREDLGNGWAFALVPARHGWDLRVLDARGLDLTQLTPPYRFAPNPREIYGWHFRNEANTGPNEGSVNAPQHLRDFLISPGVSGTDGLRAPADMTADPVALQSSGRGVLTVLDFGLADLEPGQVARMVYMRFHACLSWPALAAAPESPTPLTPEDIEQFGACGLRAPYELEAYLTPHIVQGDFDGDDSWDIAGTVVRTTDGKRAVAICRAGTWLDIVGAESDSGDLRPEHFDRMDSWRLEPKAPVSESSFAAGSEPDPAGDTLVFGIEGASSVVLLWDGTKFRSYAQSD
jgi:hypothetical protein